MFLCAVFWQAGFHCLPSELYSVGVSTGNTVHEFNAVIDSWMLIFVIGDWVISTPTVTNHSGPRFNIWIDDQDQCVCVTFVVWAGH